MARRYLKQMLKFEYSASGNLRLASVSRFEWLNYKPGIQSVFEIRGKNEFVTSYGFFAVNTLNKSVYPVRGVKIEGEYGRVYNQTPEAKFYSEGELIPDIDSLGISFNNYHRAILNAEGYFPATNRLTLTGMFQEELISITTRVF